MAMVRALTAEALKMRRTLALWLAIIGPLSVVALQVLVGLDRADMYVNSEQNPWRYYAEGVLLLWTLLCLPLFITLETALVAGVEHNNNSWKKMFALPIPRWAVYGAKQVAGMGLMALSWVALFVSLMLGGGIIYLIRPDVMEGWAIPWRNFGGWIAIAYLSSWLLISIHTWVALRWKSFVVAVAVGIVMTVAAVVVINHELASFYPWTMPALVATGFWEGEAMLNLGREWPLTELLLGSLGGIGVAVVGCIDMVRRDVL